MSSLEERRKLRQARAIGQLRHMNGAQQIRDDASDHRVYFAYSAGRIKIGTTESILRRVRGLSSQCPIPVTILLVTPGSYELEADLHQQFDADRLHGKWFRLSMDLRLFLTMNMCAKGQRQFRKSEIDFKKWAAEQI